MRNNDGKARTAARLQAIEGQLGGIWQALQQLNQAMQGHGMVLKALGELAGGEAVVQPVLDRLFAPPREEFKDGPAPVSDAEVVSREEMGRGSAQ